LDEAWRALRPSDVIDRVDLGKFFSPLHRKIVSDGYIKLVNHAPELWGMMFAKTDKPKMAGALNRVRKLLPSNSRGRFGRYVKQFKPDVVLCTHYFPLETLNHLRRKRGGPRPMAVSIVTDFEAHALWMDACVDLYCVAAEETKARLAPRSSRARSTRRRCASTSGCGMICQCCWCRAGALAWDRWARSSRSWISWSAPSNPWL
jgi:processive 1,2-diacylglycerol beta-glucosyltransferase